MNSEILSEKNEAQQETLWEMRECLLISQNSHAAMTAILQKIGDDSIALNSSVIKILHEEMLLMNTVIERMHMSIQKSSY